MPKTEAERAAMRAWRAAHQDEVRAYQRRWRAEHREQVLAYQRAYTAAHAPKPRTADQRATYTATERASRAADPERYRAYRQRFETANRAKIREAERRRHQATQGLLRQIKATAGCLRCGERDAAQLHFHHRDRATKAFSIGATAFRRPGAALMVEIQKCDVLCAPCHRAVHREWHHQRWSRAYAACIDCGTTERRHEARGRCYRCDYQVRHA